MHQQVIWHEEYARARAPGRVGIVGEGLLGPTLIAFGTDEQKARFLPGIVAGEELWCQGYCEPDAGSDLANVQTRAELDGDEWVITGQKVWTSLAQWAALVLRAGPHRPRRAQAQGHLLPARARWTSPASRSARSSRSPATRSSTRSSSTAPAPPPTSSSARSTAAGGWPWAPSPSSGACRRSASRLAFASELDQILERGPRQRQADDPVVRQRLADAWIGLQLMRLNALRTDVVGPETPARRRSINKLYWATFHRDLGELAMDVLGADATVRTGGEPDGEPDAPSCSGCSCSAGPTPSTAARTRSSAT